MGLRPLNPLFFFKMTFPQCNLSQLKTHFKILLQIHWLFFVPFFVTPHDLHNLYIIFLGFMRLGTKETNQLIQLFFFFFRSLPHVLGQRKG